MMLGLYIKGVSIVRKLRYVQVVYRVGQKSKLQTFVYIFAKC